MSGVVTPLAPIAPLAPAAPRLVGEAPERLGEITAAHRLAEDILVLLGWSTDEMARDGVVALDRNRRERGRCHAVTLPPDGAGRRWFVAAIRVAGAGTAGPGEALHLHPAGAKRPIIACLPPLIADAGAFAAALSTSLGAGLDAAAMFLLGAFSNRASRRLHAVSALLIAVLTAAAEEDGVIEISGAIEDEGILLQGWRRHAAGLPQRLLFAGETLDEVDAVCAGFPRPDLEAPAAGFIALARGEGDVALPTQLFLRHDNAFRRLTLLPDALHLPHDAGANHLRDMLPNLRAGEAALRALRNAARPRFTGTDTVSTLDRPVRMAVDLAAPLEGAGWYLTGWLLDPLGLVGQVCLRDTSGAVERLDTRWTRVPREDVSAGFRNEPLFAGRLAHDLHGFTVFVPSPGGRDAWLELTLVGEHVVFMPLSPIDADGLEGRRRLLASFDIHKPSADEIVEQHLGPLFHAAKDATRRVVGHRVLRGGSALSRGDDLDAALIIPMTEASCHARIVVASLASCDPGASVAPLFVCSPASGAVAPALLRALEFYGTDAAVLLAEAPVDLCGAIEIGIAATTTATLVVQAPSCHPTQAGWAARLADTLGTEAAAASPTLLYEDWSIRYAGIDGLRFAAQYPYAESDGRLVGMPRGALPTGAVPTRAALLECCALRRSAFEKIDGFSAGYALPGGTGLDFFLRLDAAGEAMLWVPEIELYALDDATAAESYWGRTGERIDGWSLRTSWRDETHPAAAPAAVKPAPVPLLRRKPPAEQTPPQLNGRRLKRAPTAPEIARSL